jgi:hypothetical protein
MSLYDCWTDYAVTHPWFPQIEDLACGYSERMSDAQCHKCHRQRLESPLDQLQKLDPRHSEDGIKK